MQPYHHRFCELFAQLGLPSGQDDIRAFLGHRGPLPGAVALADAPFWTPAQASLLRDGLAQDADWAQVVDELNTALRAVRS